jgi:hypothetical protein
MKFFEGCRPQFYFHGGRLVKDGKTGRQLWRLNLVITLMPEEVLCCDDVLRNNYEAIETRDNQVEELKISGEIRGQCVTFFSLAEHTEPALRIPRCDLTELRMTRVDELSELWVKVEIENSDMLHQFVKDFAFQRLWAEFAPAQMELPGGAKGVTLTKMTAERLSRLAKKTSTVN